MGELAAAHVAGVMSLADAAVVVAARGRLMQALPQGGTMIALRAPADAAARLMRGLEGSVGLAAVNGPASVVVSGAGEAVVEVAARAAADGIRTRDLRGGHAFHSPLMDPMLEQYAEVLAGVTFRPPSVPIVSGLTGDIVPDEKLCSAEYWTAHARETVRFLDAARALHERGAATFLELGPDTVLTALAQECLPSADPGAFLPTLRDGCPEDASVLTALAALHTRGVPVDWTAVYSDTDARPVDLPAYPFQRRRYWIDRGSGADPAALGLDAAEHPLLGAVVPLPGTGGLMFTGRVSVTAQPWLADHVVSGVPLLPGTALVDAVMHAGRAAGCGTIAELTIEQPLLLPRDAVRLQVMVEAPDDRGCRPFAVYSGTPDEQTRHATGVLVPDEADPGEGFAAWPPADAEPIPLDGFYEGLAERGYDYGPAFQGLRAAWRLGEEVFAEVALPEDRVRDGFGIHPALLDAALHAVGLAMPGTGPDAVLLPFSWAGVTLSGPAGLAEARVRVRPAGPDTVSVTVTGSGGAPVLTAGALSLRPVPLERLRAADAARQDTMFRVAWPAMAPGAAGPGTVGVLGAGPHGGGMAERLTAAGVKAEALADLAALRDGAVPDVVLLPPVQGAERPEAAVREVLAVLRRWLADDRLGDATLAVVTHRAATVPGDGGPPDPAQAAVAGLVRSARTEHPGRIRLIDLDHPGAARTAVRPSPRGWPRPANRSWRSGRARCTGRNSSATCRTPPGSRPFPPGERCW
ncbi:polyketide synthase dehydratase domain-containing protein [Actinomadura madurae]|nr:acyltransferase domain-containing protein [Actinomadura madurae]MCQ0003446.1 polyketide synthase dehydratase domain-containing protein [Actinomadura madurae]